MTAPTMSTERAELLESLHKARHFLRFTVRGLTDEQARSRPTASECCLGGLLKHVAHAEENWRRFILDGPSAIGDITDWDSPQIERFKESFRMHENETLDGLLADYAEIAEHTDRMIDELPDFDRAHPLPKAPWLEEGSWSARRALLHIIAETTQHAGHADIIRESIDGAKSMG